MKDRISDSLPSMRCNILCLMQLICPCYWPIVAKRSNHLNELENEG
jgi:hypothetical protein